MKSIFKNISDYKLKRIQSDLDRVYFSDKALAIKYNLTLKTIQKIKFYRIAQKINKYIPNQVRRFSPPVVGFEKKTAYYESESDLLSCPFYNPKELKTDELEIFNKI